MFVQFLKMRKVCGYVVERSRGWDDSGEEEANTLWYLKVKEKL